MFKYTSPFIYLYEAPLPIKEKSEYDINDIH